MRILFAMLNVSTIQGALGISFFVILTITSPVFARSSDEVLNQGLNVYVDPSESPLYEKTHTIIEFKEGKTLEEIDSLNRIIPTFTKDQTNAPTYYLQENVNDSEKKSTLSVEAKESIEKTRVDLIQRVSEVEARGSVIEKNNEEEVKVQYISFQHDEADENIKALRFLAGEEIELSESKKAEILQNYQANGIEKTKIIGDEFSSSIKSIQSNSNKELMDILYPSEEQIEKINQEIRKEKEEFMAHEEYLNSLPKQRVKNFLTSIQSFLFRTAKALRLSNYNGHLIVYLEQNTNYALDVPQNNSTNGTRLQIYGRNSSWAQDFYFDDQTGEIRLSSGGNKCLDVKDLNYVDGEAVHVWDCTGGLNQKWETWPNGQIRSQGARWMCLDANGSYQGAPLQIWGCHSGPSQKFVVGEDDFTNFTYGRYIRITSRNTPSGNFVGHSLISVGKRNYSGRTCHTTNTFSFWNTHDWDVDQTVGRNNNIHTANNAWVDHISDWNAAIGDHVQQSNFRHRDLYLTKKNYDRIRFMNGYYGWWKDFWNDTTPVYTGLDNNCAKFSRDLWFNYTGEWFDLESPTGWYGSVPTPADIYHAIWNYNWDNQSQCDIGYSY